MQTIKGYEGLYSADESGKIWTHRQNKFLKIWLIGTGYEMVMLYKSKKPKKFLVHRLIAITYIPNPLDLKEVNHIDGIRRNNKLTNLEWVTSSQNKQHAMKFGLMNNKGSHHGLSKLTETGVKEIRRFLKEGKIRQSILAKLYEVSPSTICDIKKGRMWNHII